jgi:hypothetical protein
MTFPAPFSFSHPKTMNDFLFVWARRLIATALCWALLAGVANAAAEINVSGGPGAYGNVLVGETLTRTFTINNPGDAALSVTAINLTGSAFAFVVAPALPIVVPMGGNYSFDVRFSPAARTAYLGNIAITSNAPVAGSPSVALSGTGISPEIGMEQPTGNGLVDGVSSVSFGTVDLGAQPPSLTRDLTFTIRNTGDANLTNISITGLAGTSFSVLTPPATSVIPGDQTNFTIRFAPTTAGPKTAAMEIASSDLDENPFNIALTGLAEAPLLVVESGSTAVAHNSTTNFGSVSVGFVKDIAFTIRNSGTSALIINSLTVTGTDNRVYNVLIDSSSLSPISAGLSSLIRVRFAPSGLASFNSASLVINSNALPSPFTVNLNGTGIANTEPTDLFGYKVTPVAGGNILPFIKHTDEGVITEATLVGIDKAVPVDIGFDFYFYDQLHTRCSISTTGLVTFGGSSVEWNPSRIPSTNQPNNFIAPLWTDIQITATSKILYKLQGLAPNRIFIIKYENVKLYTNGGATTDKRLTFQVQLYEGSNAIEIRYLDVNPSVAYPNQNVSVGLESRDYEDKQPQPGPGVIGLDFRFGPIGTNRPWREMPDNGSLTGGIDAEGSIRFTRPVVVTVESQYEKPTPTLANPLATTTVNVGSVANGLIPSYGTIYKKAIGSSMRFEAPKYIYLNRHFEELPEAGDVNDSNPALIAWYRLANDGYSVDGQIVQGAQSFAEITLTKDIKFVWRWEMEYAVNVKFPGVGTPVPDVGRSWYKLNSPLTASVDTLVDSEVGGVRLKTTGYRITAFGPTGPEAPVESPVFVVGTRATSAPMTITRPMEFEWLTSGQVRYRFGAVSGVAGETSTPFNGMSFVRVYNSAGDSSVTYYGNGVTTDVWIDADPDKLVPVEIGAFYRTNANVSYTLANFPVPPGGDLTPIGSNIGNLEDADFPENGSGTLKVARVYRHNFGPPAGRKRPLPTEVRWFYLPTVYRAEVPLGSAFDPTKTIPPLDDGVHNRVLSDSGPTGQSFQLVGDLPSGKKYPGAPLRFDQVDLKLYPVTPETYRFTWADKNDVSRIYNIEIVSGYPGQVVNLTTAREAANGKRLGSAPNYITQTTLLTLNETNPGVAFPGASGNAHYNHLFDASTDRRPPTMLDQDTTDEWRFQDLTYSDNGTDSTVAVAVPGIPFEAKAAGRSVVLYSYRPNSDEIADGNLGREKLAVRVIRSSPITAAGMVLPASPKLVLGRRGLDLGGAANGTGFGAIQSSGSSTVALGTSFLIDFWLNTKDMEEIEVEIENASTDGTAIVTCSSTSGLVVGMRVVGGNLPTGAKITSVISSTSFEISEPAGGASEGLSLIASGQPITVLSTKDDQLKLVFDQLENTLELTYFGVTLSKAYPKAGAAWRHHVIHVFANQVSNGPNTTVVGYYVNGQKDEIGFVTTSRKGLTESASFEIGSSLTANSLRFGVDAGPGSQIQMDQIRLFPSFPLIGLVPTPVDPWLSPAEVQRLRTVRRLNEGMRGLLPALWFSFDRDARLGSTPLLASAFDNSGTMIGPSIGPVTPDPTAVFAGTLARVDIQEVATRLESTLDNAGFSGSGYILNGVSNYNPTIYRRSAEVGRWGAIFPVNASQLFTEPSKRLEVAYYENPYQTDQTFHPNVAWPYEVAAYTDTAFPVFGPHRNKAIYIASRVGSEGVDRAGKMQKPFSLDKFSGLAIYHQSNPAEAGYNPNEEHALVAPSGRAALKVKNNGEDIANNPPLAAFALQADLNTRSGVGFTSAPWVLIQVNNRATGELEMAAYEVFKTRTGTIPFPRPSDAVVSSTAGLTYEGAATPEDRFLVTKTSKALNFSYQFHYNAFAGDLLIPPYPLNLVIGNVAMADARGNNIQLNGINQRTLWRDVNKNAWVVSGNGRFFHQYFYPFRADFWLPNDPQSGIPVAWLPDSGSGFTGVGTSLQPVRVVYDTFWRTSYPKLKRGETLTYQGGEYFNETPGANGLPALVAMKAAELVYDSATPSMVYGPPMEGRYPIESASARIIRPLDRRENPFTVANMGASGFTPAASEKIFVVAERWYFKELPGSLQKRFYFDSLAQKLVFRGYLNDKDSGNKDLTSGPDPLNILEPNVLTKGDYDRIRALATSAVWTAAIDQIYLLSQNPHAALGGNSAATQAIRNFQGFKSPFGPVPDELTKFFTWFNNLFAALTSASPIYQPLDSFGVGAALVPNANLLTNPPTGSLYVTIAENNRQELAGAPVSLHIVEIIPDRYRGAIKVIEAADAFSEKVSLQHNGEFGGNTGDLYYEWWIRDAGPLDQVALEVLPNGGLKEFDGGGNSLWQEYLPPERLADNNLTDFQKHLGLNSIVFEGRPDVVLADKLVLMRYRHKDETNWKLVPFEVANSVTAWAPGTPAPFQWAGAANSPQLQADGSKRYIPQLVMGWVKRILDRINPYEARYTDFFSNESPATYSSQIQIAGAPYVGNVALNSDKNVIENTGLIELYMTVLNRARSLSIDNSTNGVASDGIKQALLLAATRLSVLYELLASEAYSDAQDSTINAGEGNSLLGIASYTHAFQNMEADLMHEELALLRGTDFLKSYPVYNRLFWNYAKGLGEAAYNVNYNIYDVNSDGFINENDARKLYPQGHGDAWGHYLSAVRMHYTLLQHPGFSWRSRAELYSLMQNVLEVDFLDEKTFARLAAAKARAGRDIVRGTYRLRYTQNPAGQWQGYTDGADPARAWGVSEWAHRAGQAAWFDTAVANALLPEQAPGNNPDNLDLIERSAAVDEIAEIVGGLYEIQVAMDEANNGTNPLGFDADALTFDVDPFYLGTDWELQTHFEQVYDRALDAAGNAVEALEFATQAGNKLRAIGDDTDSLIYEAMSQDLDFRNRLIEIFGRPYDGTIGFGKAYPEGYEGPDTLLFAYLDKIRIDQIVPQTLPISAGGAHFENLAAQVKGTNAKIMDNAELVRLFGKVGTVGNVDARTLAFRALLRDATEFHLGGQLADLSLPYNTASKYGFQAPPNWGTRTSYGTLQMALQDMLADEIELDAAIGAYVAFLGTFEQKVNRLHSELKINVLKESNNDVIVGVRAGFSAAIAAIDVGMAIAKIIHAVVSTTGETAKEATPGVVGFSNDILSAIRGVSAAVKEGADNAFETADLVAEAAKTVLGLVRDEVVARKERDNAQLDTLREIEGMIAEIEDHMGGERPLRNAIGTAIQNMEKNRQAFITAQAAGFRLMREREAFNKMLASKVQKNRYNDMIFRMTRNQAMGKYQMAFNNAARYAWMAARAYDYETSLEPGHPGAPGALLDKIVKERQLGLWNDGQPAIGNGGLAEILAQLKGNFGVLKGQLGINNPQVAYENISLRSELFRINHYDQEVYDAFDTPASLRTALQVALVEENPGAPASRARWQDAVKARIVTDLNQLPEYTKYCRPVGSGAQPGIVIRFPTAIEPGRNVFGLRLAAGDHSYSHVNYATKIHSFGVYLEHYAAAGLANTPRAFLVPVGNDYLRSSTASIPVVRQWSILEQRIPIPFVINQTNLSSPNFIPSLNGINGFFGELRRHGDFRMIHDGGNGDSISSSSRLIGRSVWNSEWLLIIPGVNLHHDPLDGLQRFSETVSDIQINFQTYSHMGQ